MRGLSFSFPRILVIGMLSFSPLSAQVLPPRRTPRPVPLAPSFTEKVGGAPRLLAFSRPMQPPGTKVQLGREFRPNVFNPAPGSSRVAVNLDLLGSGSSSGPEWGTGKGPSVARISSARTEFAPSYPTVHDSPINRGGDLEYYAHHVPVFGPLMQHVLNQSKAHPRLTRVFEVIQPQLF